MNAKLQASADRFDESVDVDISPPLCSLPERLPKESDQSPASGIHPPGDDLLLTRSYDGVDEDDFVHRTLSQLAHVHRFLTSGAIPL